MRDLVEQWLEAWQTRPVLVHSAMAPDAAAAHLRTGLGRGFWARFVVEGYHVRGRANPDEIRLSLRRPDRRRPSALLFRGRLTPEPDGGSALTGSIGWHPAVRIHMAGSLTFASCLVAWRAWITIAAMLSGGWIAGERTLLGLGGAVAIWVVVAASPLIGHEREQRDDHDLRHWLRHRLNDG